MTAFLERALDNGRVVAVQRQPFAGEPVAAVAAAAHWLDKAGRLAEQLRVALSNAQVATAGLAHAGDQEDKP